VSGKPFDRVRLATAGRELLRDGRFANARVERVHIDGVDWIFKDFSSRSWFVRQTVGRLLLGREVRALRRLEGIHGIPSKAFRVDAFAMAARFVPGRTLANLDAAQMDTPFLMALEALLQQVHARALVHLDTRGGGNLLRMPDGAPGIIRALKRGPKDYQDAIPDEFIDGALIFQDDIGHGFQIDIHHGNHVLCRQPLTYGSKTPEIGHKNGGLPLFTPDF